MRTLVLIAIAAILLPTAMAHGAPEAREIDLRALTDGTATADYGGPEGLLSDGAPDLLALDIREATDSLGNPNIGFRFTHQLGDPTTGTLGLQLTFDAGGTSHAYAMETMDGATYTSSSFSSINGPFDVGDGTPKAVEGWVTTDELGVNMGEELTNIRVISTFDGTNADHMPGTYELQGQMMPAIPPEEEIPGKYTLTGPAKLIQFSSSVNEIDSAGQASTNLTITNTLTTLDQFVSLNTTAPPGIIAALDSDSIALGPGEARTIMLTISGNGAGEVAVNIRSDLGAFETIVLPLIGVVKDDGNILSGDIATGETFEHTFTTVGTFDYHCHPHPWMTAQITIEPTEEGVPPATHTIRITEPNPDDGDTWLFEPATLIIKSGDTVAWVNDGSQIHAIMGGVSGEGHGAPGHHADDNQDESNKNTPGFGPIGVLAAFAIALLVRRR